ncbi:MAG: NAD-dependent epimerase/dehydratase family protein [Gammaproteobacteria bacterium]|nr:NAD-dependent epimerase/dehydratase family protein [Gammaproteobacteria bacterium]
MDRVTVTGASGFIGVRLCERLAKAQYSVTAATRDTRSVAGRASRVVAVGEISATTRWTEALKGSNAVIHLAARAHQADSTDLNIRSEFWRINVDGTRALLSDAVKTGIKRIVFVSSIKAIGERSPLAEDGSPVAISSDSLTQPEGSYGESKLAAERLLKEGCNATGISLVILRPPLVYGPGVRGNLATLLNGIMHGVPLPFGSIKNQRSLIHREHLIDAIMLSLATKLTGTHIFTLGDCVLSTPDLVRFMAAGLGRSARLLPCPISVLRALGTLTRSSAAVSRLTESLVVDSEIITRELGWRPRIDLTSAWTEIGEQYRRSGS